MARTRPSASIEGGDRKPEQGTRVWGNRDVAVILPSLGCHGVGRSIPLCTAPPPDPLPQPQRNCASLLLGLWRRCSWWRPRWVRVRSRSAPFDAAHRRRSSAVSPTQIRALQPGGSAGSTTTPATDPRAAPIRSPASDSHWTGGRQRGWRRTPGGPGV